MSRRHWTEKMAAAGAVALCFVAVPVPGALAHHRQCRYCDGGIPWQWDDNRIPPQDNPPLPEGFVLTVLVRSELHDASRTDAILTRYRDVADALGRCWDPTSVLGDQRWGEITLRVSFKRDGSINGIPRTIFVQKTIDQKVATELRDSLLSALAQCTPLHFSPSLGSAVAGQIFAIRFIQQGPKTWATKATP